MGLEHVREGILAEGRRAAEQELAQARAEAKAIVGRAEAHAAEVRNRRAERSAGQAAQLKRRDLALAELEAKKLRLQAQKDLLQRVRTQALERLRKLPPKQSEEYIAALAKRAAVEEPRAYARAEDRALVERTGLAFAGPVEAVGGLVVESSDGATREDLRYEHILEDAWRDALGDVANQLFGAKAQPQAKAR